MTEQSDRTESATMVEVDAVEAVKAAPWEPLAALIEVGDADPIRAFLHNLGSAESARAISRLDGDKRQSLMLLLGPDDAAALLTEVTEIQAATLIEDLPPEQAAAIVDQLPSNQQADVLAELGDAAAHAILERMAPADAAEVRQLLSYPADSAGGLMITEYLSFRQSRRAADALSDLQANRDRYADYDVQYVYVVDDDKKLRGVMRMRDLLFAPGNTVLTELMVTPPLSVRDTASLSELEDFFNEHRLFGVPVIDAAGKLTGVIRRDAVNQAIGKRADRQFLDFSGIVGGEEFRSMPLWLRSGRRLSWLSVNILLNIVSASIIALYQDTLAAAITLAIFLPMISDMSGCSGNQAVAVSMRELTLGLVRPNELLRVLFKEAGLGVINGIALGLLLAAVALVWKGNPYLGMVVGSALAANTLVAVSFGGLLPLILKKFKLDPALVAGPLLTTVTDMCGFFFVFTFAGAVLPKLAEAAT